MQKVTKRNIALAIIFLLILVVVALLIGNFTFSYLGADISDDVNTQGETTASGDTLIFSSGNTLSLHATTDNFNATSGNLTDTTNPSVRLIASSRTNSATATYFAGIRIYENTYTYSSGTTAEVILTVRDENGALLEASSDELPYVTVNDVSGFDITGKTGAFNIAIDHPISTTSSTNGTTHTWTFTLTFVNLETDQSINENASIDMEVVLQQDRITIPTFAEICREEKSNTLACKVATNYTEDGENGLYYHDGVGSYTNADQEAGDNSYRYSGANPNNYVCFGATGADCQNEDNQYRIIGVFNNQVKLIKATSYGSYVWNADYDNTWNETTKPDIYTTLNETYYNTLGSEWQNLIAESTWQVGGMVFSYTNTVKQYYDTEIKNQTGYEETMAVGLMYVSDYGYGADPSKWTTTLSTSNYGTDNWLYSGAFEWLLSRVTINTRSAFFVNSRYGGSVSYDNVSNSFAVRPSFSLTSTVTISSGTGTSSDPFVLNLG